MNINFLVFICLILFEQQLAIITSKDREIIYLPMKKDHKYGDDICYYRELDEKPDYAVYYVKPCEKGKYCQDAESSGFLQPFGFCKDIQTNATDLITLGKKCSKSCECQGNLVCDDSECKKKCSSSKTTYQTDLNQFSCIDSSYKKSKYCYEANYKKLNGDNNPITFTLDWDTNGEYPGLPQECGIIIYDEYKETKLNIGSSPASYKNVKHYLEVRKEWCLIGGADDGAFVTDWRFCKSGFTLKFYPNKDVDDPEGFYSGKKDMCVTPTAIDNNNPLYDSGCIITYKDGEGDEKKYKISGACNEDILIQSQIYTEFIEEFNKSTEDQTACYRLPLGTPGNCQNINLLKLAYFYQHPNEYLFYKDRKKLDTVLHFKIQEVYHRYYEFGIYLNINYLFVLLFLILF